jgi:hypothetical protein
MSRLARTKMEGSGIVSEIIKQLAPLALSPIASAVGDRVGRWISPRKSGSGYKTMGMGYKTMGMGENLIKKKRSPKKKRVSQKKKKSPKKGGYVRRNSKKKAPRRRPVSRQRF